MSAVKNILRIDLSTGTIERETVSAELSATFLGGRGLASKILVDEVPADVDPLSPRNKLIMATGPLTGTKAPTGGRYMVVTKGPLTGTIASSNSGGFFGAQMRFSGHDLIIFEGKAENPVYLSLNGDRTELKSASQVWGKDVPTTTDMLLAEIGDPKARVACIGPAGEKLVLFAAVMNDKHRAAGRTGVGAVMGSKNLKAVVISSPRNAPEPVDETAFNEAIAVCRRKIKEDGVTSEGLPTFGTKVLDNIVNAHGIYPTNNFKLGTFADVEEISGEALVAKGYLQKRKGCFACPIACGRDTELPSGRKGEGPEYESGWSLGAMCGVKDLIAISEANFLCNEYGLDTISTGATIAAAMELYEEGLIGKDELCNGPELTFGSSEAVVYYAKAIGAGEGFGKKLALGSYRLAESYGRPELSMSVKKQELPAYDPRGTQGQGLAYATQNRGGCHVRAYLIAPEILAHPEAIDPLDTDSKPQWVKTFQDLTAVIDSAGLCLFTSFALGAEDYLALINAATGSTMTVDDLLQLGERIWNVERLFNLEAGFTAADDTLPPRLLEEPLPDGPSAGHVTRLADMLPAYYQLRGWTADGIPTGAKKAELGL